MYVCGECLYLTYVCSAMCTFMATINFPKATYGLVMRMVFMLLYKTDVSYVKI